MVIRGITRLRYLLRTKRKLFSHVLLTPMHISVCPFACVIRQPLFQICMMSIFIDMVEKFLKVFVDDFTILRETFDECLNHLEKVFTRYEKKHLVLN